MRGQSRRPGGGRRILALFAIACMPASICGAGAAEEDRPVLSALFPELAARIELPAFLRAAQLNYELRLLKGRLARGLRAWCQKD